MKVFLGLIFGVLIPFYWAFGAANIQIQDVKGTAIIHRQKGVESTAKIGDVLDLEDQIRTESDSSVVLELADGSAIKLGSNSRYKVAGIKPLASGWIDWSFELIEGSVRALVSKSPDKKTIRFKVQTPEGTLGVRGTEFLVSHQAGVTKLFTFEGIVAISKTANSLSDKNLSRDVKASEFSIIKTEDLKPSEPKNVDPKDLSGFEKEQHLDPLTFEGAFPVSLQNKSPAGVPEQKAETQKPRPTEKQNNKSKANGNKNEGNLSPLSSGSKAGTGSTRPVPVSKTSGTNRAAPSSSPSNLAGTNGSASSSSPPSGQGSPISQLPSSQLAPVPTTPSAGDAKMVSAPPSSPTPTPPAQASVPAPSPLPESYPLPTPLPVASVPRPDPEPVSTVTTSIPPFTQTYAGEHDPAPYGTGTNPNPASNGTNPRYTGGAASGGTESKNQECRDRTMVPPGCSSGSAKQTCTNCQNGTCYAYGPPHDVVCRGSTISNSNITSGISVSTSTTIPTVISPR